MKRIPKMTTVLLSISVALFFFSCDAIIDRPFGSVPDSPLGLAITSLSFDNISLSWYEESGVGSFIVYQSLFSNGPFTVIATDITSNQCTVKNLSENTKYYFTVSAKNSVGESVKSIPVIGTTISLYEAGYKAFLNDINNALSQFESEKNQNPYYGNGIANYSVGGENNGNAVLKYHYFTINIAVPTPLNPSPQPVYMPYIWSEYSWNNYTGANGCTLTGETSTFTPGNYGMSGTISITYAGKEGTMKITCPNSNGFGCVCTFSFNSETHTYQYGSY